jgi:hypothetical protein
MLRIQGNNSEKTVCQHFMATLKFGGMDRRLRPWAEVAAQLVEQTTSCSKFEG